MSLPLHNKHPGVFIHLINHTYKNSRLYSLYLYLPA